MGKLQSSLLVLSALLCLTWGWESGTQYVYKYVGRSTAGIYQLKMQHAVIELHSRVTVQSINENNIAVKLTDGRILRNGNYLENPFFTIEQVQSIEGTEDKILNPESLGAPFIITHTKGSITSIKIGADEPLWVVNFKKSIASQLQMDITGVRADGPTVDWSKNIDSASFNAFEDSVTGDCSNNIAISRLSQSQIVETKAFQLASFDAVCKGKPVYRIVKTKDFNNCKSNPVWHTTTSNVYTCDFDKANCGDFLQRTSVLTYIACGDDLPKFTVVQATGFSDLAAQPFATDTDKLLSSVMVDWSLEKKESISSQFNKPATIQQHKSMSHVFDDWKQLNADGTPAKPNLVDAYYKSPVPVSTLHRNVLEGLRAVARDLKERPDEEKDNIERLAVIGRVLPMFSLDELKLLWQDIKGQDYATITLFVDCVVQSGSNPAVMLIKELVESQQITGAKATWALAAVGYYVKTPTRELLHELVNLLKSNVIQSSKSAMQTTLMTVADLLNTACGSRFSSAKRFPIAVMGDFCNNKDTVIIDEFLPLLIKELESSTDSFDRIVTLAAFGSLGVEEIVPILLPVIRGTPGQFDDTAERVRAILSLHRVVFVAPNKIHPILASLASNVGERPEVRMAAMGLLFMSNAPLSLWQKFAASTWFEPSKQVASFVHTLVHSAKGIPTTTVTFQQIAEKANVAWPMVKPAPFGLPFSFADIRSSHLDEGISVMMHTVNVRDSDQSWPVYLANRYSYQLGPLAREPVGIYMWNFNMADVWQNLVSKIYGRFSKSDSKSGEKLEALKGIWEQLNVAARPADKRAGLLHINLMGSINRFINLAKLEEEIPKYLAGMIKYQNAPYEVSVTKYRMLGEYNVRFPTDLGLPMRYLFTLPILMSMQGNIKADGQGAIKSDIAAELSWKISAEIRVEIPFSGNYIATGVDVLIGSHAPKELVFSYPQGDFKAGWIPGSKVTDLLYYHVKPYTVSRNLADSIRPTLEDQATHIISVTDKPRVVELPYGDRFGLNIKFISHSELPHSDKWSWIEWMKKWDINSWSNLGCFLPLQLNNRKYVLRYDPSGTRAKSVMSSYFYQYATKSSENTLVYESGSSQSRTPSQSEIVSYSPITPEFRPLADRMFEHLETGNARLMRARLIAEQKDGTSVQLQSLVGLSRDARYTKDFHDWQVEWSTSGPSGTKKIDNAICYWAVRNWNNAPTYGFSKDVLYMNEEDKIGFGPQCEHQVKFTARLTRDESAAQAAINSKAGQRCLKDMESGFKYGSPSCTEARQMDQTYNNYEMVSQAERLMTEPWLQWARSTTTWMNQILAPFIVKHSHAQTNTPFRASWTIKRDPISGDSDMTFVRPHETVVAKNVRWGFTNWARFSPLTYAYAKVFYPLKSGSNFVIDTLDITSAGVSESKCYVGDNGVHTFDGAHYNYTVDGCAHVLMTDCYKKSNIAVVARQGREGQKIVTVVYGRDTFELDPTGYVVLNGQKTAFNSIKKGSFIEIRKPGNKGIQAIVYPLADGGVMLDIRPIYFFIKIQGSHVELSAPVHMRGKACGLCGDFNQEVQGEWKTPGRCVLSSGDLMAASFKLKSGEGCSTSNDVTRRLKAETETCASIDQHYHTYLPDYVL